MAAYSGSYKPQTPEEAAKNSPAYASQKSTENAIQRQGENHSFSLQNILKRIEAVGMETDDLLLALVLFLMYRESGDKDLLILLGAMLLS